MGEGGRAGLLGPLSGYAFAIEFISHRLDICDWLPLDESKKKQWKPNSEANDFFEKMEAKAIIF